MDEKDKPRIEYVMDFPMRGEYARIRLLVSHILAKHPYLALDQIDFKRDHISDATLQGQRQDDAVPEAGQVIHGINRVANIAANIQ